MVLMDRRSEEPMFYARIGVAGSSSLATSRSILLSVATVALFVAFTVVRAEPISPRHILVQVPVAGRTAVQAVASLGLDVWRVAPDGSSVDIRVSEAELTDLRARGYAPLILEPDLYALPQPTHEGVSGGDWTAYHDVSSTHQMLVDLAAAYPDLAVPFTMGTTWEGRPINGLRISDAAATVDPSEPAFFIIGCHDAREWITVEVALYIAEQLLTNYDTDSDVRSLVDRGEIWIIPVLNVDGYAYTQIDRWWRKNRRANDNGTFGVDLNRNYSYEWGRNSGSSPYQGSDVYRGPSPLSEPETIAVSQLFESRRFIGVLTFHNYSQFVVTPWGYTILSPTDYGALAILANELAAAINGQHADTLYDYTPGQWSVLLYLGSGVFVDWVYGQHGVASILVEVRPRGSPYFELPPDEILPTCVENYAGALQMIERVFGPEPEPPTDFDGDGVTLLSDVAFLTRCMGGPGAVVPGFPLGCYAADLDGDGAVTLADAADLFVAFGGP